MAAACRHTNNDTKMSKSDFFTGEYTDMMVTKLFRYYLAVEGVEGFAHADVYAAIT